MPRVPEGGRGACPRGVHSTTTLIVVVPASVVPIDLTASRPPSQAASVGFPRASFVRPPERYLVPLASATALFLGLTLVVGLEGWLRGYSLGLVLTMGGGALLSCVGLLGSTSPERRTPALEPARSTQGYESAFVCSKCSEYTAAPDWEALLQDLGPTTQLEEQALPQRTVTSVGPWTAPVMVEVGPRSTVSSHLPLETPFVPPDPRPTPPFPGGEPDLMLREGRLVPIRRGDSRTILSSGRKEPPEPSAPGRSVPGGGRIVAPPEPQAGSIGTSATEPFDLLSPDPFLERWIAAEAERVMARSRGPSRNGWVDSPVDSRVIEGTGEVEPDARDGSCATCKKDVPAATLSRPCPDCRRPTCAPCRDRAVEHDGERWCPPCAVNRLSAEFLSMLEASSGLSDAPQAGVGGTGLTLPDAVPPS
jgi:hypothetical protein